MMIRKIAALAILGALAACGNEPSRQADSPTPAADPMPAAALPAPKEGQTRPANPALDATALESRDCAVVADFYAQAIQAGDYASAEKVWKTGLLPDGGMAKQFVAYRMAKLEIGAITQEGAAGSLYCEVPVTLIDAGDPRKAAARGTIILRRVNDVDGATPEQLRWHIEKSEIQ